MVDPKPHVVNANFSYLNILTIGVKLLNHKNMIRESYDTIIIKTFQSFKF
jgi:hypothetical protein